jgi:hypothetical protein
VSSVAATPINDLNLAQTAIPEMLREARRRPYRPPDDPGCAGLAEEIDELDELLGPDLDALREKRESDMVDRGSEMAGDAAMDAFKGVAEDVIPFRGWVRKLSGAERHSKRVTAALVAGSVRRAYLKGMRAAQGCHVDPPTQAAAERPPPAVR